VKIKAGRAISRARGERREKKLSFTIFLVIIQAPITPIKRSIATA
jgi:hypothetical protein